MNRDMIRRIQFDPALSVGARNATRVCLRLQPAEQLTLITDREGLEIAAALIGQVEEIGAPYRAFVLEELAPRPLDRRGSGCDRSRAVVSALHGRLARANRIARRLH